jgi:hypothetical protein
MVEGLRDELLAGAGLAVISTVRSVGRDLREPIEDGAHPGARADERAELTVRARGRSRSGRAGSNWSSVSPRRSLVAFEEVHLAHAHAADERAVAAAEIAHAHALLGGDELGVHALTLVSSSTSCARLALRPTIDRAPAPTSCQSVEGARSLPPRTSTRFLLATVASSKVHLALLGSLSVNPAVPRASPSKGRRSVSWRAVSPRPSQGSSVVSSTDGGSVACGATLQTIAPRARDRSPAGSRATR